MSSYFVFDNWGFSLNLFFTLIAFKKKKGNVVPMPTGVRLEGWAKTNYIIANRMYTRQFAFSMVHGLSYLVVLIPDHAWPV